jgi:hypothetical protein
MQHMLQHQHKQNVTTISQHTQRPALQGTSMHEKVTVKKTSKFFFFCKIQTHNVIITKHPISQKIRNRSSLIASSFLSLLLERVPQWEKDRCWSPQKAYEYPVQHLMPSSS